MTAVLTRLAHRGPRAADRRQSVPAALRPITGRLRAGGVLMAEVAALFAEAGCRGGMLWLDGVVCDPFRYVLPALALDDQHAAFYSETYAPAGRVVIGASTASVGARDGGMFLHCHGRWIAEGREAMGHLLPFDTRLAEDAVVHGLGAPSAWFEGIHDAETNFTLFSAIGGDAGGAGLLARLRPDEDVVTAIETLAAGHGLGRARVHGIGSICGVLFDDGRRVDCPATEVRIDEGWVEGGRARIAVSVVDVEGGIHTGVLRRALNPVGVTFELALEPG